MQRNSPEKAQSVHKCVCLLTTHSPTQLFSESLGFPSVFSNSMPCVSRLPSSFQKTESPKAGPPQNLERHVVADRTVLLAKSLGLVNPT